jgi:tetratricopeptide (TPR) repeat protein
MATDHPQTISRFAVLGYLGSGATGRAYRALDPRTNQPCVVQLVDARLVEEAGGADALRLEVSAIANVGHPNVSRILEVQLEEEPYYLTTEYVPGTTLRDVIDHRRLSFAEALRIFKDVCAGLQAVHRKGIFHHALSPHSVVLTEDLSVVKLTNFGLGPVGYFKQRMSAGETLTFDAGPLSYLSPEHVRELRVDARSDIYSAGVILYECLTGAIPAGRFSLPSQRNSEVPPELDPIVLRCLSSDPEQRYPSAQHLLSEIRLIEEKLRLGLAHTIQGAVHHQRASGRPLRFGLFAAAVLLLVLAALVGLAAWRHTRSDTNVPGGAKSGAADAASGRGAGQSSTGAGSDETGIAAGSSGASTPAAGGTGDAGLAPEEPSQEQPAVAVVGEGRPGATVATGTPGAGGSRTTTRPATAAGSEPPPVEEAPAEADPAEAESASAAAQDIEVILRKVEASLFQPALADIETFVARHPGEAELLDALRLRARVQAALGQGEPLRATIVEMETRFRADPRLPATRYSLARLLMADSQRRHSEQAKRLFEAAVVESPDASWASEALFAKAEIEEAAKEQVADAELGNRVPAAALTLRGLADRYPDAPKARQALTRAAELFEEAKLFEAAGDTWLALAKRSSDSEAAWKAARHLDRRGVERERALEAYRLVAEGSSHYAEAQKRIARLGG